MYTYMYSEIYVIYIDRSVDANRLRHAVWQLAEGRRLSPRVNLPTRICR